MPASDHWQRLSPEQRRSFFPESSNEDMEDEAFLRELSCEDLISNEIRRYQLDKGLKLQTDGYNHKEYPHICKVAEQILAIPATSAPSERVFSSAANIVDKKRVRLKPEMLIYLYF
jgi:hypothetical protein